MYGDIVITSFPLNTGKIDFIRDSVTLVVVISIVIAVAFDGVVSYIPTLPDSNCMIYLNLSLYLQVYLTEVLIFPLLYVCYIVVLLLITFLRVHTCIYKYTGTTIHL